METIELEIKGPQLMQNLPSMFRQQMILIGERKVIANLRRHMLWIFRRSTAYNHLFSFREVWKRKDDDAVNTDE